MRNTSQKTINKYTEAAKNKVLWGEREIISFRSFLNIGLSHDRALSGSIVTAFYNACEIEERELTPEQQTKGIEWLIRTQLNSKMELRKAKTTFLGERERATILNFSHFTFSGLYDAGRTPYSQYMAVYKCYAKDGSSFEYTFTGAGMELV